MNLGLFLNLGEGITDLAKSGQDERFINHYLKRYKLKFYKILIFSYKKEKWPLPDSCFLIPNKYRLHRFLYAFFLSILNYRDLKKCDVIRVTQLPGVVPAIITKILYGKRFVATYGYDYKKFNLLEDKGYLNLLFSPIEFLTSKFADKIIVSNEMIKKHLLKNVAKEKIFYLPNGVDIKVFKPCKKLAKPDQKKIKILFVGRLVKQKNLFTLIKAVGFMENKKNIILTFIGDGGLYEKLVHDARLKKVNLQIIRKVPYGKMPMMYQKADLFILPSTIEGHPKVLLEALSCGLPCLVNRIEATTQIIKDWKTGIFFEKTAENLAEKLKVFFKKRNQAEIAIIKKNGRKLVKDKYNLESLLEKEIKLLENLGLKS